MDEHATSHKLFHSFCLYPALDFETKDKDEEIVLMVRAHPITQLYWVVNALFLVVISVFVNATFLPTILTQQQILFLNRMTVVFILAYLWLNFLGYYFNLGIITNRRIVDLDFHAIIYKEFTEARLIKVEDVTSKSGGYFASLFNFGNVFVQTAGSEVNIEFVNIPRPTDVVRMINEVIEKS